MKRKCEICGKEISKDRLKILPETKRCIECARRNGTDVFANRSSLSMDSDTYKDLLSATRS